MALAVQSERVRLIARDRFFSRQPASAAALISLLLSLFAAQAWHAVRQESATWDETGHFLAGYTALKLRDYRLDTEHPLLWKLWAALPDLFAGPYTVDTSSETWKNEPRNRLLERGLIASTLFSTRGNDTEGFLARARFMMLLLGVALGAVIATWAWELGGPTAGVGAALFYSFDPNFLAHAPLVVNDVALTLGYCATMYATWRVGRRATAGRIAALAVVFALTVEAKYSALAAGPILVLLLLVRAASAQPWAMLGGDVQSRGARVLRVVAIGMGCALAAYAAIWIVHGFRFGLAPDPSVRANLKFDVQTEAMYRLVHQHADGWPSMEQIAAVPPSRFSRVLLALDRFKVLPEPFIDGLLFAHANAGARATFLLGSLSVLGHWYYFPFAILVKTPLGTLTAVLAALGLLAIRIVGAHGRIPRWWDLLCLALPPVVYLGAAMSADLNIGLRHVLPIYPFLFVGIGVAGAVVLRGRQGTLMAGALAVALVAESSLAAPDYLSFFNSPAGGERGGLALLGDSNLDWGQGLKQLAIWQREHPDEPLQLAYFGSASPEYYGVHARLLSDGADLNMRRPSPVGTVAISASLLQNIGPTPDLQPIDVLGGSLYLFRATDLLKGQLPTTAGPDGG